MILFTILAIILLVLVGIGLLAVTAGGAAFTLVFGDVIVCVVLIALIIRALIKRKK